MLIKGTFNLQGTTLGNRCLSSCGDSSLPSTSMRSSATYLSAVDTSNYQNLAAAPRLKPTPPVCKQNTAALEMGVSLSGFILPVVSENTQVGGYFSFCFLVY